ncbi:MAG: DUF58 domain-containing protein [Verrucomicrobia bacterium]|jgi:uncharacterized protein (DUF58 family)|nr:DUF58 domain-containing protein [Verrucomicrobiota bacterium]MBT7065255.1 DUF58 domain-containing protein [Verrucomicrobiota bacterium]MBT7701713.1 DUF58 domain-containing protein [Verrucomicrobiota bacterium]
MQGTYLDPSILSKVGSLDVVARQVVEGMRIGMHRSPARGISSEFTAYRQYVPGDDVQHIDWKSYARSDRYYIKLYEAETNFVSNLLLDVSSSMTYGSGNITKLEYAKYLAASLAYLVVDQGDSAGIGIFDGELQKYIMPKSSMGVLVDISRELEQVEPKPRTDIGQVLSNFAHRMARRGVVVLFSDMLDNTDEFIKGINHLRFRGHNVIVFHILDPAELNFPFKGTSKFVGLEEDGDLITQPDRLRDRYLEELTSFITKIRNACTKTQVDYVLVNTADPIEHVLSGYLLQRSFVNK